MDTSAPKKYSGFKDVDGKKIFENDRLGFFDFTSLEYWEGLIVRTPAGFMVSVGDSDGLPLKQIAAEYRMRKLPG